MIKRCDQLRAIDCTMLLLLLASSSLTFLGAKSAWGEPQVIRVSDDGYPTIQSAINAAEYGDTVFVSSGTYEENLVVNKTISLIGEDAHNTIIDGSGLDHVVNVTAQGVTLTGFTIRNSHPDYSGIYLHALSDTTTISGNNLTNNNFGIWFQNSGNNNVTANILSDNFGGVYMAHSRENLICRNIITKSTGSFGIRLEKSSNLNIITENTIINNTYTGIFLSSSEVNQIIGNLISNNQEGIMLSQSNCCRVNENTITNNTEGLYSFSSNRTTSYRNNFMNNTFQALVDDSFDFAWDNGAEGNYWSDHETEDADGDGIGDDPYMINARDTDNYPLIEPWSSTRIYDVVHEGETLHVSMFCDSTVASFNFSSFLRQISFRVTGPSGNTGLCNVTVPVDLLSGYTWLVLLDGTDVTASTLMVENSTHTSLFLNFNLTTRTIKIVNADLTLPRADAGLDQTVNEDTLVTLDGSASWDDFEIVSYTWTFVDVSLQSLNGEIVFYNFTTPGVYMVTLNVSDAAGSWATDTVVITVLDVTPPVANAGQNQTVAVGTTVIFDASGSRDNVGIVSYFWDFGDNSTLNMTTPIATHIYTESGDYIVALTVKDAANNFHTDTITVTVVPEQAFPLWQIIILLIVIVGMASIVSVFLFRYRKR